jgi:alkyl hydroperoxide reductase subunit D
VKGDVKMSLLETRNDLLKDLNLNENVTIAGLDAMAAGETKFLRDLRINVKNVLGSENLSPKEAYLLAASAAINEKNKTLTDVFISFAADNGASEAEIAETYACTSALATNNVFYRFKHFIKKVNSDYDTMSAGIKMNIMMSPVLGKEFFELMSLVISALNGCESCVNSHEASLRNLGTSKERIFDAIRLAAVIKGLTISISLPESQLIN